MNIEQIKHLFTYHPPTDGQRLRYAELNDIFLGCAIAVARNSPESMERTIAIRALQLARMWANAAIAINEAPTATDINQIDALALIDRLEGETRHCSETTLTAEEATLLRTAITGQAKGSSSQAQLQAEEEHP